MADSTISGLSSASALDGTEVLAGDQAGATKKIAAQSIADLLRVQGVNSQTGTSYTYVVGDRAKLVIHSNAASIAASLPQPGASFPAGWFMIVQNRNVGVLTITPVSSTIDGAAALVLVQGQGVIVCSDGTNWFVFTGGGSTAIQPSFRVEHQSGSMTLTANTDVKVPFATTIYDPFTWWDGTNNRWVPKQVGKYHFSAIYAFAYVPAGSATKDTVSLKMQLNGSGVNMAVDVRTEWVVTGTGGFPMASIISLTGDCQMNGTTDYIELFANSLGGGTNTAVNHHFSGFRVSA